MNPCYRKWVAASIPAAFALIKASPKLLQSTNMLRSGGPEDVAPASTAPPNHHPSSDVYDSYSLRSTETKAATASSIAPPLSIVILLDSIDESSTVRAN